MTSETDGKTIDQISIHRIYNIISSLKNETYKPHPDKRGYISEKNGKKRQLGIPFLQTSWYER